MLLYALIFLIFIFIFLYHLYVSSSLLDASKRLLSIKKAEMSHDEIYHRDSMHRTNHELISSPCEEANLCWYLCARNTLTRLSYYSERVTTAQRPRCPCFQFQRLMLERPSSLSFYCRNLTLAIFFFLIYCKMLSTLNFLPNVAF